MNPERNLHMTIPAFPVIIAYEIFYFEEDRVYYLPGGKKRVLITHEEYYARIKEYRAKNIQYMLLYDYMLILKKDKWEAIPEDINIDEVELYYELGILGEEDYQRFKYLYSEYGRNSNPG
jgi:hypothetical protein